MKTRYHFIFSVFALVAVFLESCAERKALHPDIAQIKGNWQLYYMPGYTMPFETMFADKKPVLSLDPAEERFKGQVICNDINGKLSFPDSAHIRFTDTRSTSYPCKGFAEPSFMDALKVTEYFHWQHRDTLWLYRQNMLVMKLVRLPDSSISNE